MTKYLPLLIVLFFNYSSAKERKIANVQFTTSKKCELELQNNTNLQSIFRTIKLNVQEYQVNPNGGYSAETGQAIINAVCRSYETVEKKEFNLCKDIEENVTAYQKNPQNGYSLETAKKLDKMAGKKCLAE